MKGRVLLSLFSLLFASACGSDSGSRQFGTGGQNQLETNPGDENSCAPLNSPASGVRTTLGLLPTSGPYSIAASWRFDDDTVPAASPTSLSLVMDEINMGLRDSSVGFTAKVNGASTATTVMDPRTNGVLGTYYTLKAETVLRFSSTQTTYVSLAGLSDDGIRLQYFQGGEWKEYFVRDQPMPTTLVCATNSASPAITVAPRGELPIRVFYTQGTGAMTFQLLVKETSDPTLLDLGAYCGTQITIDNATSTDDPDAGWSLVDRSRYYQEPRRLPPGCSL